MIVVGGGLRADPPTGWQSAKAAAVRAGAVAGGEAVSGDTGGMRASNVQGGLPGTGTFVTTRWTMVLSAASCQSPLASVPAAEAMAQLCQAYWLPLYSYVRRCGHSAADAEDLAQEFFATLLSTQALSSVDRGKGKFRHFLLAAMKHFLSNQRDRASAVKRGGRQVIISLDRNEAEGRYGREPADLRTPEMAFERQWAMAVLQRVLDGLKEEYIAAGKERLFDELKGTLAGNVKEQSYKDIALRLSTTEGTIKVLAYRFRRRYRQLLCEEIGQTVAQPGQIEEEIRDLIAAVSA